MFGGRSFGVVEHGDHVDDDREDRAPVRPACSALRASSMPTRNSATVIAAIARSSSSRAVVSKAARLVGDEGVGVEDQLSGHDPVGSGVEAQWRRRCRSRCRGPGRGVGERCPERPSCGGRDRRSSAISFIFTTSFGSPLTHPGFPQRDPLVPRRLIGGSQVQRLEQTDRLVHRRRTERIGERVVPDSLLRALKDALQPISTSEPESAGGRSLWS